MTASAKDKLSLLNLKIARLEYEKASVQYSKRIRNRKKREVEELKDKREELYIEGGMKMKSRLNPLQKCMAEDMILYYHNAKRFRDQDEPEHEASFLEKYKTERDRLTQSLKYPVSVRGDNSPCYFVVNEITHRTVYIEGDK